MLHYCLPVSLSPLCTALIAFIHLHAIKSDAGGEGGDGAVAVVVGG